MFDAPLEPVLAPVRGRIVVGFAGGGGSSIAIHQALGVHPDAALNHWPLALGMHQANFPETEHWCADILETDPRWVTPGPLALLWLSPDCRHFSKAKGGAPVSPRVRGLAWVAIPWAKLRRPDVIMLENVEEFVTWGPLVKDASGKLRPDPARAGETFARWKRRLEQCGYVVEHRVLCAADHGAPTIRKRLFLVARCDGKPIVWPEPTHAPRKTAAGRGLKPWRAAAEIIDFSRPCPSIFLSREEARALGVKRPLEEATLRRIAKGLYRYTIAAAEPFIVPITHRGDDRTRDINEPLATITTAHRGEMALIAPVITGCGGRMGQTEPPDPRAPYPTITSKNDSCLAAAYLTKFSENSIGQSPGDPLHTVMAGATRHGVVSAHLVPRYGERPGQDPRAASVDEPYPTVVATNNQGALIAAFMEQANTGVVGHDVAEPVSAVMSVGVRRRLVAAQLVHMRGSGGGNGDAGEPARTLTAGGGHQALLESMLEADQLLAAPFAGRAAGLRAFLIKYYGSATAQDLADPLGTVTARSRFGLVMVSGLAFRIVDIGMRMLDPETELAAAMGVPKDYRLGFTAQGARVTKTAITKMVGNMVCPAPAEALIRANFPDWAAEADGRAAA